MGNPQPPAPLLPHGEGGESQNPAAPSPLPNGGAGEGQNPAAPSRLERVAFDSRGLITAVVQDATTREVLMVAWMNADALRLTQETGEAHFWSRSRGELWHKGATSGHIMRIRDIRVDCDADTLLLLVDPAGPACHTGAPSCFFRTLKDLTDTP